MTARSANARTHRPSHAPLRLVVSRPEPPPSLTVWIVGGLFVVVVLTATIVGALWHALQRPVGTP